MLSRFIIHGPSADVHNDADRIVAAVKGYDTDDGRTNRTLTSTSILMFDTATGDVERELWHVERELWHVELTAEDQSIIEVTRFSRTAH